MAGRRACSSLISISGNRPNGCADCALWRATSLASGSHTAITSMATPGANNATGGIEMATASILPVSTSPQPHRLEWRFAEVVAINPETSTTKSIVLSIPDWAGHLPGQHVDLRLTADDGYQAQRSYSIAS